MKTRWVWAIVAVLVIGFWSGFAGMAIAQDAIAQPPSSNLAASDKPFWEKLERLRDDTQLQRLVEEDIEKSLAIREQIQLEVDRTFSHTTTLLNVLLVILTAMPILAGTGIWFLRRSVINQIATETRKQLQEEVEKQLAAEVAEELKQQAAAFQKEIDGLKTEFDAQLAQLKSLIVDAQQKKNRIIQELSQVLPSPLRESSSPELHQKIQALTQQLNLLKSANAQLDFTANDYVEQGRALYFEGQFEEAIALYDKGIELEPDNPRAWFGRGASLAKLQRYDEALIAYDKVIDVKPDFSEAWFGRGVVLAKLQQYPEAIAAYEKATTLKPDLYLAWFGKARCYALTEQPDQAIQALEQAIALNSEKCVEAVKTDAVFETLRSDQRLQTLLAI